MPLRALRSDCFRSCCGLLFKRDSHSRRLWARHCCIVILYSNAVTKFRCNDKWNYTSRFVPCRLDFDTPLSSTTTLIPQSPLPSRHHPSVLYLACLPYTSFLPRLFLPSLLPPSPPPPFFSLSSHSILLCIPIICPCSFTGFVTRDYACDVMLGRSLQRRALGPAALFSEAPDCRWRRRLSQFFALRHIFSIDFFVL